MKILVFGASGATGHELVRQGLAAGHQVSAFVRNPASFSATPDLQVIQGDVFDPEQVAAAIQGQDAVFTALGARTLGTERSAAEIKREHHCWDEAARCAAIDRAWSCGRIPGCGKVRDSRFDDSFCACLSEHS